MKSPTVLELFAAFAMQYPLLTREDLASTVEAMRGSAGFRRMMEHAREQASAIGLPTDVLELQVAAEDDADDDDPVDPSARSGFFSSARSAVG